MSAGGSDDTALGTARGRFVASLPRKAVELRGVIALLTSTPAAVAPRDEMRRRLQTLYASALVFRDDDLAELVKGGIERIDLAQQQGRGLTLFDLEGLARVVAKLPTLHKTERGVAVLTAALRDEPPPDPEAADAAVQAALDAQLPEVTEGPGLPVPPDLGDDAEPTVRREISEELAEQARVDAPSPGSPPPADGPVALASVDIVSARVPRYPRVVEEIVQPTSKTLSGLPPVGGGEDAEPTGPVRPTTGMRQGRTLSIRPHQAAVVEYGSADDQARRSQPPAGGEGRLRLGSSPIVAAAAHAPDRTPLLQRVVRVLVLDSAEHQAQIRLQLPRSGFDVVHAEDPETALRLARGEGPDVLVARRELAEQADFVRRLRSDPLTDFVPVVLLTSTADPLDPVSARELGADEVMIWPTQGHALAGCIGRLTGTLVEQGNALAALPEATLEELADRVADEIRHGLVDSAESGLDLRIPLGGGAEVLAAAWAAVARVRAFASQQTGGRIRFRDLPTRGGPAVLALVEGDAGLGTSHDQSSLRGRAILVVDDDPAVVWFFAGLLREEGATVYEAHDGKVALEMARARRPDVVISDILMPELDGFALCRALQRDPLLADVPVILLSWKEDLLHRMRELQAGARGYLRKEAAAAQILGRVREVLRSRRELEEALLAGGEVRGNLEGIGLVGMLHSVARARPNCRVTIRDAWNVFEVELRGGTVRALTRTSSDGALERGEVTLPPLLGTVSGRFAVTDSQVRVEAQLEGDLDAVLARGALELGALIEAVSGAGLLRARRVEFDPDALGVVRKQSPGPVRDLVERLHRGAAPAEVLLASEATAQTLEAVLIDLARRGAIQRVVGGRGQDVVALALAERRGRGPHAEPEPTATPEPTAEPAPAPEPTATPTAEPTATSTAERTPERTRTSTAERTPERTRTSTAEPTRTPTPTPTPTPTRRPPPPQPSSGLSVAWLLALAVLLGLGFFGAQWLRRDRADGLRAGDAAAPLPAEVTDDPSSPTAPEAVAPKPRPKRVGPGDSLEPLSPGEGLVVPQDVGFQVYDGITDSTVEVAESQGLLIVGAVPGQATTLRVDGQPARALPAKVALDEGIHALELHAGETMRVLFVAIAPDRTWVLAKP